MSKHYLEAYINKTEGPKFRIVCEDVETCQKREESKGCIYQKAFRIEQTIDMVGWPNTEYVLGRIDLRYTVNPSSASIQDRLHHGILDE
jgi:hypothetical protein